MNWFSRRAAYLTFVMALTLGMMGTARAQVTRSLTVAVLNFSNSSGVGGALIGNKASAAVETQLIESGRYDVVKSDLVTKTMSDLSLTYPLGRQGLTQLAQALEADAIVTGDVVRVVRDPKTNQVRVTLRIEMTDRTSGELTNGAVSTGESGIRPDFSGAQDVLLDEALNKVAFGAVRSMNDRILPEGTVFATSSRGGAIEALLNIGTNSGVVGGMEFIVLRNREQVARLRATEVSATDTTAVVVSSTRGVQPEDKVRAVFRVQDIPVDMTGAGANNSVKRPRMNFGNLALGASRLIRSLLYGVGPSDVLSFAAPTAQELPGHLIRLAAARGFELAPDAARFLITHLGTNLTRLSNELDRLALWAGKGGRVEGEDLDEMVADATETSNFALGDALVNGDRARALLIAEGLISQGSTAGSAVYPTSTGVRMTATV